MSKRSPETTHGVPPENVLDLRRRPAVNADIHPVGTLLGKAPRSAGQLHWPRIKLPAWSLASRGWRTSRWSFKFSRPVTISLVVFIVAGAIMTSPFFAKGLINKAQRVQGAVLAASTEGYGHLEKAGSDLLSYHFTSAESQFDQALDGFALAQESLHEFSGTIRAIVRLVPIAGSKLRSGEAMIAAGRELASAGQLFSEVAVELEAGGLAKSSTDPTERLSVSMGELTDRVHSANTHIKQAAKELKRVRAKDIPTKYRDAFRLVQEKLPDLDKALSRLNVTTDVIEGFLGSDQERLFLLVFQNDNEIRPTGGFMGSLALCAAKDGILRVIEVPGKGFLDLQHPGMTQRLSPKPLWLVNPLWQAQDANWWPDFPTSAEAINRLYEESRGYSVDGIIAITPKLIEDALRLTGPINLPDYSLTVDAESLTGVLQEAVEVSYDRELNQPKQVVGALLSSLVTEIFDLPPRQMFDLANVVADALGRKDILLYAQASELEANIKSLRWGGEMLTTEEDYLFVVDTNIGGGKTDRVMSATIDHEVTVDKNGQMNVQLSIQREHHGDAADPWTNRTNVDYLRVYVPAGSELVAAGGFSQIGSERMLVPPIEATADEQINALEGEGMIDETSGTRISRSLGYTVFGNWVEVPVGESRKVFFNYRLPFRLDFTKTSRYSLLLQSQPGVGNRQFHSQLTFPEGIEPEWFTSESGSLHRIGQTLSFSTTLNRDQTYAALFTETP